MTMLFMISQDVNSGSGTFNSAVVSADSAEEAKWIHPYTIPKNPWNSGMWVEKDNISAVKIRYICETRLHTGIVVLASFNAG